MIFGFWLWLTTIVAPNTGLLAWSPKSPRALQLSCTVRRASVSAEPPPRLTRGGWLYDGFRAERSGHLIKRGHGLEIAGIGDGISA